MKYIFMNKMFEYKCIKNYKQNKMTKNLTEIKLKMENTKIESSTKKTIVVY